MPTQWLIISNCNNYEVMILFSGNPGLSVSATCMTPALMEAILMTINTFTGYNQTIKTLERKSENIVRTNFVYTKNPC